RGGQVLLRTEPAGLAVRVGAGDADPRAPDAGRPGVLRIRLQPRGRGRPPHAVLPAHGRLAAAREVLGGRPGPGAARVRPPAAPARGAWRTRDRGPHAGGAAVPGPAQGRAAHTHGAGLLRALRRPRGARRGHGGLLPARLRPAGRPMTSVPVTSGTQWPRAAAAILSEPSRPRAGKIAGPAAWPPPARSS